MTDISKTITALILTIATAANFAACMKVNTEDEIRLPEVSQINLTDIIKEDTESEGEEETEDHDTAGAIDTTSESQTERTEATYYVFNPANLIKIGEHTYYPDYIFKYRNIEPEYQEYIISRLTEADKDLHDDLFVYTILESEYKDEYRFFGKMIMDGIIFEEAEMMAIYDPQTGYVWDYNIANFRRSDPDKTNLMPEEELCKIVSRSSHDAGYLPMGTYLLKADGQGRLYYEFTIDRFSLVTIDAHTGELITEHYWDGIYY